MANEIDSSKAILNGYSYALLLGEELYQEQLKGCVDCYDASKIERIIWLAETLQHYIDLDLLDETTDNLYTQLLDATDDYYGDGDELDPKLVIPNTIIGGGGSGNSQWGFITGDINNQADLISLLANKADIGDGFITNVTITKSGNNIIVTVNNGNEIKVKIGSRIITQSSPQTLPVATATNNYFRKDWLAGTLTGLQIIQGVEDLLIGTLPSLGVDQVGLAPIDIYGAQVNPNPPNPPVDISAPSWTVYGNVPFGKYGNGVAVPENISAFAQYKEAWTNVAHPNYLAPILSLSSAPDNQNLEVGQTLNLSLVLSFVQNNAGTETTSSRVVKKNGVNLAGFTDAIVISTSNVAYQGFTAFAQGAVLNNEAGIPDPIGRINAATTSSGIRNYIGNYFNFFAVGSIATNSAQVRALTGKTLSNTFALTIPAGQTQASFAYPATKADIVDSSIKYVEGFNSNVGNTFTKSLFNVNDAGGVPVAYKIYTVTLPAPEANTVTYNITLPS